MRKKARLQKVEDKKGKNPLAVSIDERKDTSKVKVGENDDLPFLGGEGIGQILSLLYLFIILGLLGVCRD